MSVAKICSVEGCERKSTAHGWCPMHVQRWYRWGDPLTMFLPRHGGAGTPTYRAWTEMRRRCRSKNRQGWKDYGGRGVTVCDRWQSFPDFLADMGLCPGKGYSIDRKNNEGNYEPGNCKWSTVKEQANNRRSNNLITAFGKTQTATQWCEEYDLPNSTFYNRLRRGWGPERALTSPGSGGRRRRRN